MRAGLAELQFLQALVHRPGFDTMVTIWEEDGYLGLLEEFDIAVRCADCSPTSLEVRARDGATLIALEGPDLDRPSVRSVADRLSEVARKRQPRKPAARAFGSVSASFVGRPAQSPPSKPAAPKPAAPKPTAPKPRAAERSGVPDWHRAVLCRPGFG